MKSIKINGVTFNPAAVVGYKRSEFIKEDSGKHGQLTDAQLGEVWDNCNAAVNPPKESAAPAVPPGGEVKGKEKKDQA